MRSTKQVSWAWPSMPVGLSVVFAYTIMSDENTHSDAPPQIDTFAEIVEALFGRRVSAGNNKGFFLNEKDLNAAEKQFKRLVREHADELMEDQVEDISKKLGVLRSDLMTARQATADESNRKEELVRKVAEEREALQKLRSSKTDSPSELAAENSKLKQQLNTLQVQLGQAKIASKTAMRGFDPAEGKAAQEKEDALRVQVKELETARKGLEKTIADAKLKEAKASADVADLAKQLDQSHKNLAALKSKNAMASHNKPLEMVDIEVKPAFARLVIGDAGIEWLKKIDLSARENMRDYAFHLMKAANSNNTVRGLGDLLHLAWSWLQTKAYAVRETLRPWLNRLHHDLAAGKVAAIKVYREMLEEIIGDFKTQKAKLVDEGKAQHFVDIRAAANTVLSQAKKAPGRLQNFFSSCRHGMRRVFRWMRKVASYLKPAWHVAEVETEDEVLFDHKINVQDLSDGEVSENLAPETVPVD